MSTASALAAITLPQPYPLFLGDITEPVGERSASFATIAELDGAAGTRP